MSASTSDAAEQGESLTAGQPTLRGPSVRLLLGVLPFAVMVAVASADLLAGPAFGLLPLLSLGPAPAAVSLSPLRTALVGGLGAVMCLPLGAFDGLLGSRRVAVALATIAGITAAGVVASVGRRRRERHLADITAVAEAAQLVLLRPVPAVIGDVRAAVRYDSASAAARIGGDLYAVIVAEGSVRVILGGVQGHGLPAVQTAGVFLGAFREAAYDAAESVTGIALSCPDRGRAQRGRRSGHVGAVGQVRSIQTRPAAPVPSGRRRHGQRCRRSPSSPRRQENDLSAGLRGGEAGPPARHPALFLCLMAAWPQASELPSHYCPEPAARR